MHGIAGLTIFILPIVLVVRGVAPAAYVLVALGGADFGLAGLLLAFLRMDRPIIPQNRIFSLLPILLLVTTAMFVIGMNVK